MLVKNLINEKILDDLLAELAIALEDGRVSLKEVMSLVRILVKLLKF